MTKIPPWRTKFIARSLTSVTTLDPLRVSASEVSAGGLGGLRSHSGVDHVHLPDNRLVWHLVYIYIQVYRFVQLRAACIPDINLKNMAQRATIINHRYGERLAALQDLYAGISSPQKAADALASISRLRRL